MPTTAPDISIPGSFPANPATARPPFGVNEVRLSWRQWLFAFAIFLICAVALPKIWKRFEPFRTGPDYRMPYALSKDYWLYQRRLEQVADPRQIPILGDSVVWGEYVRADGTFSHFLNERSAQPGRFINCGVNGMFPLALEGLVKNYGATLKNRKIIVQCNVLWMSSPRADLSSPKEQSFNHSRLVPQFGVRIPSYRADANERLSAVIENHVEFFEWIGHLQNAYFDQKSIPQWTLQDDGNDPPKYPNGWRNPLAQLKAGIPAEPAVDPQRGPASPRHKPWNADGAEAGDFEWVELDASLQWQAFQRIVQMLHARGDDVLVIVGPFNEHMIAADQRATYHAMRSRIAAWLAKNGVAAVVPQTLPSDLYADASHPLTAGYARLAREIWEQPAFRNWLGARNPKAASH